MDPFVVRLFGEPSLRLYGRPWAWSVPARCKSLLALLVMRDAPASRVALATQLWPEEPPSEARASLRRYLHRLMQSLPRVKGAEWIGVTNDTVGWNHEAPAWIDVREFEKLLKDSERRNEAVALYRGDLLEGVYEEAVLSERERLRERFMDALADLIRDARERRDFTTSIAYADRLLSEDEWREDALRDL